MLRRERRDQRDAKRRKLSSEGELKAVVEWYHWMTGDCVSGGAGCDVEGFLPKDERASTTRAKTAWVIRSRTVRLIPGFATFLALANMEMKDMVMHSTESRVNNEVETEE